MRALYIHMFGLGITYLYDDLSFECVSKANTIMFIKTYTTFQEWVELPYSDRSERGKLA